MLSDEIPVGHHAIGTQPGITGVNQRHDDADMPWDVPVAYHDRS